MKLWRRLPRWIRALTIFLVAYFAADVFTFAWTQAAHFRWASDDPSILSARQRTLMAARERSLQAGIPHFVQHSHRWVLGIAAVVYGLKRSSYNHPARMPRYKEWLRATPWQAPMPLPLGPPTFQWWDGLVVVVALALNFWNARLPWQVLIFTGCTAYAFGSLTLLLGTERKREAYSVTLGLSLILWSVPHVTAMLAVSVAIAAIAHEGLRRSLYGFPWEGPAKVETNEPWPLPIYENVNPQIPFEKAVFTVVLITSWLGGLTHFFNFQTTTVAFLSAVIGLVSCLIRLTIYCANYKPPLTFLSRILRFRLVIPGYDQALVVPLAGAILAVALPLELYRSGFTSPAIAVSAIGPTLLLLFTGGPALRVWQLTGYHYYSNQQTKRASAEG